MVDQDTGEIRNVFVRNPYNYDRNLASIATGLVCVLPTRTQQQFKDECDINEILRRFGLTGHLPLAAMQPMEGDFTGVDDYQSAMQAVAAANENFMLLPSAVRDRFNQEPRRFVEFCTNPANIEAVREMGLAPRPAAPALQEILHGNEGNGGRRAGDRGAGPAAAGPNAGGSSGAGNGGNPPPANQRT